jgi:hypothetical protein
MKAEADCMFLEGVNQIVEHGFPYSAPGVEEPGWSLYAAAALNDHNPWWPLMHDVTAYIQRVSWALRQGEPANDVALLLPEDDAQAAFRPGHVSVTAEMRTMITPELMGAILDGGYNVDYIDLSAIEQRGLHYPIVVVPPTERMPLRGVHALEAYVAAGGKLIFLGQTPTLAAGLTDAADTPAVSDALKQLLQKSQLFRVCCGPTLNWQLPAARLASCTGTLTMETSTSWRTLPPSPFHSRCASVRHTVKRNGGIQRPAKLNAPNWGSP